MDAAGVPPQTSTGVLPSCFTDRDKDSGTVSSFVEQQPGLPRGEILNTRDAPYHCPESTECFNNSSVCQGRGIIYTGENPCKSERAEETSFKVAVQEPTGGESGSYNERERGFAQSSQIGQTVSTGTGLEASFACLECGKSFRRHSQLVFHVRSHTGEKPFACNECGRSFSIKSTLVRHQNIHKGRERYVCCTCGKGFTGIASFSVHQKTHVGEKPYECNECGKRFLRHSQLVIHLRNHTGEKPFACDECGKRFSMSSSLARHQFVHKGERPCTCHICGRNFKTNSSLLGHQKAHTKPFACDKCDKRFSRNSGLLLHMQNHTGDKPYSCSACGKLFSRRWDLTRHSRTHSEKPFQWPTENFLHQLGEGLARDQCKQANIAM